MSMKNGVADWVAAQPSRSFFTNNSVPGSVRAVESSLSRLAGSAGPIERVRQGLYWKKPSQTRFGTARPDPTDAAFAVAGPGAGLAGASAANALGLSTQVSRQPLIAVVGQCPKGLHGVQFTSRSNPQRIKLSPLEVTLLEVLRDFPNHGELGWPAVRALIRRLVREGRVDLKMVALVAASERRPGLTNRIDDLVFKGGTSLSKAYGIIERFSEDIDVLVVCQQTGHTLKRLLRDIADRASHDLGVKYLREKEGKGFLNARYSYPAKRVVEFLKPGVLLEMGSRGGPSPNEQRPIRSLMSQVAEESDPIAVEDYVDLAVFRVTVLAPERTLAEKLAFLHHRSTVGDHDALRRGARHLYDSALLLRCDRVIGALADGGIVELMADIDQRSAAADWSFTPRPENGFATSVAFGGDNTVSTALRDGYAQLVNLVWGDLPTYDEAIDVVRSNGYLL